MNVVLRSILISALIVPCAFLAACGGATANGSSSALSSPTARATATAAPYRDLSLTFHKVDRNVADTGACTAIGRRANVATIAVDLGLPAQVRLMGAPGANCIREVHAGDTAYAYARTAAIYVPHVAVDRDFSTTFAVVSRPARTLADCVAAGRRARTTTIAYLERYSDMYVGTTRDSVTCYRPVSSDDSAADSAIHIVVAVPAREVGP